MLFDVCSSEFSWTPLLDAAPVSSFWTGSAPSDCSDSSGTVFSVPSLLLFPSLSVYDTDKNIPFFTAAITSTCGNDVDAIAASNAIDIALLVFLPSLIIFSPNFMMWLYAIFIIEFTFMVKLLSFILSHYDKIVNSFFQNCFKPLIIMSKIIVFRLFCSIFWLFYPSLYQILYCAS